uniref:Uncharacterized protein n=1 Tax=Anguilla anguilla TaxID=7936 RepID=A0A0E9PSQ0_ANGAN
MFFKNGTSHLCFFGSVRVNIFSTKLSSTCFI